MFYLSDEEPLVPTESDLKEAGDLPWYRFRGHQDWDLKDFPEYRPVNSWSSYEWLRDQDGKEAVIFFWTEAIPTPARYPYEEEVVWWYGRNRCDGSGDRHEPSWPEVYPDRTRPEPDCRLKDRCEHNQGWHTLKMQFQILFYDPSDLAKVASGELKPFKVLPYDRIEAPPWFQKPCRYGGPKNVTRNNPEGSAFDEKNGLLYFAQGGNKPVIHVLRLW